LHFVTRPLQYLFRIHHARGHRRNGACVSGRTINNLCFADDIGLMAEMFEHAQFLLNRVDQVSSKYGQKISQTKREWMVFSTKPEQIVRKRIEEGLTLRGKRL